MVYPGKVRRGKEWDAFCDEHKDDLILSESEAEIGEGIASAVKADPVASRVLYQPGMLYEQTIEWDWQGRPFRCTPDARSHRHLVDLKTTRDAEPEAFQRQAFKLGYHAQLARYARAIEQTTGNRPRDVYIVAVENKPPFGVTVLRPLATAGQFRNALTTYLWGNRGAQGLPPAATITGMPASMTILPGKQPATQHVPRAAPAAPSRRRKSNVLAYGVAACAIALITAFAVAWRNPKVAPAAAVIALPQSAATQLSAATATESTAPAPDDATASVPPAMPATPRAARPNVSPAPARVVIAFAVAPWGEVYVNGKAQGTTPPLTQLMLPAGRHTIELRNGQRLPYIAQVEISPDQPQRISHRFQ